MKKHTDGYKIGDLASMFGLTARTIRYYEELGLLKSNDRIEGLHRRYPERTIIYLKRIRQLKSYDLSLGEIKEFFDLAETDESGELCRALLVRKFEEKMEGERRAIADAKANLDNLAMRADCIRRAKTFFSCPGMDCDACEAQEECNNVIFLDEQCSDPISDVEEPNR
jgi:DNA-binding transcriptional MerR regulator